MSGIYHAELARLDEGENCGCEAFARLRGARGTIFVRCKTDREACLAMLQYEQRYHCGAEDRCAWESPCQWHAPERYRMFIGPRGHLVGVRP